MAPDSNLNSDEQLSNQGYLTELNCPLNIKVKTESLNDQYDVETRPFAR